MLEPRKPLGRITRPAVRAGLEVRYVAKCRQVTRPECYAIEGRRFDTLSARVRLAPLISGKCSVQPAQIELFQEILESIRSSRGARKLVTVNCAALPSTLVESELFGYERGAFTGACQATAGRFEVADGSTILLDEIGELPPEVQPKLLRVVQTGEFQRLGSSRTIRVDVRIIAATNRDLAQEVAAARFRADLYYRLNVFPVALPPLRRRAEDIPLLVWHFITREQAGFGKTIRNVPDELMSALRSHHWPGNVRELRNVIERALILTEGETLTTDWRGASMASIFSTASA